VHGTKLWSNLEKHLTRSRNEVKQFNTSTKSNKLHYPYQNNNKFRKVYCHRQSGTAVRIGCNIHWQVSFPHLQCVCVCVCVSHWHNIVQQFGTVSIQMDTSLLKSGTHKPNLLLLVVANRIRTVIGMNLQLWEWDAPRIPSHSLVDLFLQSHFISHTSAARCLLTPHSAIKIITH
jgi:hypothetical protein